MATRGPGHRRPPALRGRGWVRLRAEVAAYLAARVDVPEESPPWA